MSRYPGRMPVLLSQRGPAPAAVGRLGQGGGAPAAAVAGTSSEDEEGEAREGSDVTINLADEPEDEEEVAPAAPPAEHAGNRQTPSRSAAALRSDPRLDELMATLAGAGAPSVPGLAQGAGTTGGAATYARAVAASGVRQLLEAAAGAPGGARAALYAARLMPGLEGLCASGRWRPFQLLAIGFDEQSAEVQSALKE